MLFLITQVHTPETCPKNEGGSKILYNPDAEGVELRAMYGAFSEHVIYYVVEADNIQAINGFLDPGWTRCTCTITPVNETAIVR